MNIFENLVIFEMANNHQGSVEHGLKIIKEMGALAEKYNLNAAVKLQYRDLDTFIHPIKRKDDSIKYIKRFLSTELKSSQFYELIEGIRQCGMKTVVTPFDENSVDTIVEHGIDIIKVASCSADDWPLLEKIASVNKPVIASTGGLNLIEIDSLVSFFGKRVINFGLLHCVSIYPTPLRLLNIQFLTKLIVRYPDITIGYSGHENPQNTDIGKIAYSLGARIFERHVALPTDKFPINAYSMTPAQTEKWIKGLKDAKEILGENNKSITVDEKVALLSLKRGVFAKKNLKKGEVLTTDNTYFAFPCEEGQLTSGEFGKLRTQYVITKAYKLNEAIFEKTKFDKYDHVRKTIHDVKGMLIEAGVVLNEGATIELSHHYGLSEIEKFGCIIVNLINREYCKKIIIALPGQFHPEQYHVKKEETFHVLSGKLNLTLNGILYKLKKGDIKTIERGIRHTFSSKEGAIIEEVSTTHYRNDSFYLDPKIEEQDPMARKTIIEHF